MDQYRCERYLTFLCSLIAVCAFITSVCCAVAWNHWKFVMDTCPTDQNCGCILYGKKMERIFWGGDVSICHWVVYGPVPVVIFFTIVTGFHFVRVCIGNKGRENIPNITINKRNGEIVVVQQRQVNPSTSHPRAWLCLGLIYMLFAFYMFSHAVVLSDGYYKTCAQYRRNLINELHASGNQQAVIYKRLSCAAVYDYMDYIFPNFNDRIRHGRIDTSADLNAAIYTSWFSVVFLLAAAGFNLKIARLNKY